MKYKSGVEIESGDTVLFHGEPGEIEFVIDAGVDHPPDYFREYANLLNDPKLMNDVAAVRTLANLKGGFFIPRSEISSAEIVPKQKEGMAGIHHTGRIV